MGKTHHTRKPGLSDNKKQHPNPISIKLRTHCVSVRLNDSKLIKLNKMRGSYAKGVWLRMASLQKLPPIIPTINTEAWKALSDISQKLNRIAAHIDGNVNRPVLVPCIF
ncbi:Uncharacterised protein [Salmonella enterica]|uniref:Uncharacterized protein n=1 Tax=Salmonella enterica TaxID=28901 RepID=A0A379QX67_SALER|nr:Uncharacterised protein [Salmonella enterica]